MSSLAYLSGVLASISLFDFKTPLDERILLPAFLSLGIVLLSLAGQGQGARAAFPTTLALAAFLVLALRQIGQLGDVLAHLRADGQGYAASRWVGSEVGRRLDELAPNTIYTNDITAVYFIAHAPSCAIPTRYAEEDLARMRGLLQEKGSVLAIFGQLSSEFMPLDRLTEGLSVAEGLADGFIYIDGINGVP